MSEPETNQEPTDAESSESAAEADQEKHMNSWYRYAPWVATISSILFLGLIAYYLFDNTSWFRDAADLSDKSTDLGDEGGLEYRIHVLHLQASQTKRTIALFAGFAILLIGGSISLYTVQSISKMKFSSKPASLQFATASPGIVAMLLGTGLIMFTIQSKDHFNQTITTYQPAPAEEAPDELPVVETDDLVVPESE